MNNNAITQILTILLGVMIFLLMVLSVIFLILKLKETKKEKSIGEKKDNKKSQNKKTNDKTAYIQYNKKSIMDFMEFDNIQDNMIIQKKGKRYLMVIECQGVNYDLMSRIEKISVEEGFQQFLNTLRHPIQIYIQTRTVNLESSISVYKDKLKEIEEKYINMTNQYNKMKESREYSQEDIDKYYYELIKQKNLFEYGKDVINNTEKMSLNKNVLNKKYYIIIPYYSEESLDGNYMIDEIREMAFSELYSKAQSLIRVLTSCSVTGKILSSRELIDLLYVAYNRDQSEKFGIDKALMSGYDELYSTSRDVFEKKIEALDKDIKEKAIDLANETIEKVKSRPQIIAEDKQNRFEELVKKMAEVVINDNKSYIGKVVAKNAIEEIKESREGGKKTNEEENRTTRKRNVNKK